MDDDIDNERDFWHDEPTRRLSRLPTGKVPRVERVRQHVPVVEKAARPRGIDPFLARLGLMVCIGVLMVPLAYTLRHGAGDVLRTAQNSAAASAPVRGDSVAASKTLAPTTIPATVPVSATVETTSADAAVALDVAPVDSTPPTTVFDIDALPPAVPVNDVQSAAPATTVPRSTEAVQKKTAITTASTAPATTTTLAPMAEASIKTPACSKSYKVASGDYWIGIAKKAGVTVKALLAANNATVKTSLYPGRSICLPKGASTPAASTTPTTIATQATKATPTTAKPKAPTTTTPPTTTLPARTYTAAEVEAIIRDVWPDDLEDEAVRIATRESNLKPAVRNSCCIGLFQIYWSVHKGWLSAMGITSPDQLFDPRINATAGYALYQRSGGWGPWAV